MSFATLDDLTNAPERAYGMYPIAGLGNVLLQTIRPSEYAKVEGLKSRAGLAMQGMQDGDADGLLAESDRWLVAFSWVDDDKQRTVSDARVKDLDRNYAVFGRLLAAVKAHSGIDVMGVERAAKNYEKTHGASSSTGAGGSAGDSTLTDG